MDMAVVQQPPISHSKTLIQEVSMDAQCPYALYLARLSQNSKRSIQAQLEGIAVVMGWSLVDLPAKLACV